nr:immunoglobulin light chain junction region [Macaca mulatta]MOX52296.1 immunoglobulin light chain junction region [Macaca mulatta]MOX52673.1 immunoglobulin light chain junction region [Macaca mulatta]MOX52959.1 immunoglobulin light chain junction region [Macaca mulatta]MOX54345.1 immunoglobulin light chain junction region [Macaca mulatta]
CHQYNSLPYTF